MSARRKALWVALIAGLSFAAIGCKDQACIEWSTSDGACPSQNDANSFMVQSCGSTPDPITSVDSDGTFDDNLCCYDVTKSTSTNCPPSGPL